MTEVSAPQTNIKQGTAVHSAVPCVFIFIWYQPVGAAISRPPNTDLRSNGRLIAAPTLEYGYLPRADRVVRPYKGSAFVVVGHADPGVPLFLFVCEADTSVIHL